MLAIGMKMDFSTFAVSNAEIQICYSSATIGSWDEYCEKVAKLALFLS